MRFPRPNRGHRPRIGQDIPDPGGSSCPCAAVCGIYERFTRTRSWHSIWFLPNRAGREPSDDHEDRHAFVAHGAASRAPAGVRRAADRPDEAPGSSRRRGADARRVRNDAAPDGSGPHDPAARGRRTLADRRGHVGGRRVDRLRGAARRRRGAERARSDLRPGLRARRMGLSDARPRHARRRVRPRNRTRPPAAGAGEPRRAAEAAARRRRAAHRIDAGDRAAARRRSSASRAPTSPSCSRARAASARSSSPGRSTI